MSRSVRVRAITAHTCWIAAVLLVVIVQPLYLLPIERQLPIVFSLIAAGLLAKRPLLTSTEGISGLASAVADGALILATLSAGAYIALNYHGIIFRQGAFTDADLRAAFTLAIVAVEVVRRAVGWPLTVISLVFVAYAIFGRSMPAMLVHRGYSPTVVAGELVLSYSGIYGVPLQVMLRYVILFIVFGTLLQAAGASEFLVRFAQAIAGRFTGGLGKVAVMASALVGTISGSAAGNVATTGAVTIPAMKRGGYEPHVAGAIEAVASTGGQIMPPIMGAAAFLMADYLGIPYSKVALAAVIPALLYFLSAWVAVDRYARRHGIRSVDIASIPRLGHVLRSGWWYLVPIVTVYMVLVTGFSPTLSALLGIGMVVVLMVGRRVELRSVYAALRDAGESAATLTAVAAGAGVIVGVVQLTGLGARLASALVDLSMGYGALLLILVMGTSTILGMGMPTTVVYVLLAALVAPALTSMGYSLIASHFFIFYFGVLAAITPPVALASYAAASIANTSPDRTAWTAFAIALPSFLVPFFFVTNPVLLLEGSLWAILHGAATASAGVWLFSSAIFNHFRGAMPLWLRAALVAAAVLLIDGGWTTDLVGALVAAAGWLYQGRAGDMAGAEVASGNR